MSIIQALILGIVQGLTEFLPVSSSGHLKLGQHLLGLEDLDQYVMFDLVCHLGTLLAIVRVFSRELGRVLRSDRDRILLLVIATLPLFPLALIIKPLHELFALPSTLGFAFLITACLLWAGERFSVPLKTDEVHSRRSALLIGLSQALAIIPGISRSGSTISTGRLLGWDPLDAARFSFLMAIPAILGGVALESLQLIMGKVPLGDVTLAGYVVGFLSSFVVGWFTLSWLMQLIQRGKLHLFAWYCLILGVTWLTYLHLL